MISLEFERKFESSAIHLAGWGYEMWDICCIKQGWEVYDEMIKTTVNTMVFTASSEIPF